MEYILIILLVVLVGLGLSRKVSAEQKYWGYCYWCAAGMAVIFSFVTAPYRIFRILDDISRLVG